jgi:hypothetical protein
MRADAIVDEGFLADLAAAGLYQPQTLWDLAVAGRCARRPRSRYSRRSSRVAPLPSGGGPADHVHGVAVPPSTGSVTPVTRRPAGDTSHRIALEMSSGST